MKKKVYLIYEGEVGPYEPAHIAEIYLNEDKARKALERLQKEDKEKENKAIEYLELSNRYDNFINENNLYEESYDTRLTKAAEYLGITEEFLNEVLGFCYYPQLYYIETRELEDIEEDEKDKNNI